jgi:hypothetical protein
MTMELFADLSQPANVNANELDWVPSPLAGVDRRMLDRIGDEVARATTIVRYQPNSFFSPHSHTNGEEYYVLEGVFSDESGDYPAGYYVRNPDGSLHQPFTKEGCRIYVKLRQMDSEDQTYVTTNTLDQTITKIDDVTTRHLHKFNTEEVMIRELQQDQTYTELSDSGLEILVLSGKIKVADDASDEEQTCNIEHWLRWPGHQSIALTAVSNDVRLLVKKNHL